MNKTPSRRSVLATTSTLTMLSVAGCLGGDGDDSGSEYDIPEASFAVTEDNTDQDPPNILVAHSGDPITEKNTSTVEVRSDPGDGNARNIGVFDPITEGTIDGTEKRFTGSAEDFQSGNTIRFFWISTDGERESELDSWDVP